MANGHTAARNARLGTFLLMGGIGAVLVLWAIFAWAALPNRLSGMNGGHAFITYVSTGVCAVILILAHVAIIRHLRGYLARVGNATR